MVEAGTYSDGRHLGEGADMTFRSALEGSLSDLACCTRFYSRLPVPPLAWEADPHGPPDFDVVARMLPFAGAILGCVGAAVLSAALLVGLGPWLSATLAIASLTLVTGAFHEDGLADTADAFGGATTERRLAIMRDSRIGSFGASALILAFALRVTALATLAERLDIAAVAAATVAAAIVSRTAALLVFTALPPARTDGAAQALGQPSAATLGIAAALAAGLTVALSAAALSPAAAAAALLLPAAAAAAMVVVSKRLLGGQTGDIGGATQQLAEIAALIGVLLAA